MDDWTVAVRIAGAVGEAAVAEGTGRNSLPRADIEKLAHQTIEASRACIEQLVKAGLIRTDEDAIPRHQAALTSGQ
jgi:hypothetical protein